MVAGPTAHFLSISNEEVLCIVSLIPFNTDLGGFRTREKGILGSLSHLLKCHSADF